jgi:glycine dehydrogenase subunit 2
MRRIAEQAILNANYLKAKLSPYLHIPYPQPCMHEFVAQLKNTDATGIRAIDVAKRLLDFGFYAPTVYFPLIIKEGFLIEPTETESKATLDHFVDAIHEISEEIRANPQMVKSAPHNTLVKRLDEVKAAREPLLMEKPHG